MRTPKPPTARSVSATLRFVGFRAFVRSHGRVGCPEGFLVGRDDERTIWVRYVTDDPDLRETALAKMADALRHKGWLVMSAEPVDRGLLVRET